MPAKPSFDSMEEYYNTLFHELAHSTGHPARLDRSSLTDFERFGDHNYSREELVAEMGPRHSCGVLWHRESNHSQQRGLSGELVECAEERLLPGARRSQSGAEGRGSNSRRQARCRNTAGVATQQMTG
jgi:antirestriction protein ArdC